MSSRSIAFEGSVAGTRRSSAFAEVMKTLRPFIIVSDKAPNLERRWFERNGLMHRYWAKWEGVSLTRCEKGVEGLSVRERDLGLNDLVPDGIDHANAQFSVALRPLCNNCAEGPKASLLEESQKGILKPLGGRAN